MESKILTGEQKKTPLEGLKITGLYTRAPHEYGAVFTKMSGTPLPDFGKTMLSAGLEQERQGNFQDAIKKFPGGKVDLIGGLYTSLVDIANKQLVVKMNF